MKYNIIDWNIQKRERRPTSRSVLSTSCECMLILQRGDRHPVLLLDRYPPHEVLEEMNLPDRQDGPGESY